MFGKLLKGVKQTEWLTPSVMMNENVITITYILQNHFVNVRFPKPMKQHKSRDTIPTMNNLIVVVSIVAVLVTISTRAT
jgi:hypothetical protein